MKRPLSVISGFFVKALAYYVAFLGLWMLIGESYATAYRASATKIFRKFPPHGTVFITAKVAPTRLLDSELRLGNDKTLAVLTQGFSARYHAYAPTRLMLSLILASPFPWRRRCWAVLWGLLLVHAWIVFALFMMIMNGYSGDHAVAMYTFRPSIIKSLMFVTKLATEGIIPRYVVPAGLWILVTFRRGDWEDFMKMLQAGDRRKR